MYVHIGNDVMIKISDIIAIFDVEVLKQSRSNLRILNMLKNQSNDIKSVIIIQNNKLIKEVFSIISPSTLKKRIEQY